MVVLSLALSRGPPAGRSTATASAATTATTLLKSAEDDEDEDEDEPTEEAAAETKARVIDCARGAQPQDLLPRPARAQHGRSRYVDEVRRIARENAMQTVDRLDRRQPKPSSCSGHPAGERGAAASRHEPVLAAPISALPPLRIDEEPGRRWYPVIDYSRCTNCMECIDFCLFGVYGVDKLETILVEQPDNCRKGCPACSRVCPENAIIFPQHKTPAIAGSPEGAAGALKIDLSKLFGAPGRACDQAVAERDAELVADGRDAVGMTVGIPKRQTDKPAGPKDDLDKLMDQLDDLGL